MTVSEKKSFEIEKLLQKKILLKEMKILFTVEDNESKHSWTPVLDL